MVMFGFQTCQKVLKYNMNMFFLDFAIFKQMKKQKSVKQAQYGTIYIARWKFNTTVSLQFRYVEKDSCMYTQISRSIKEIVYPQWSF